MSDIRFGDKSAIRMEDKAALCIGDQSAGRKYAREDGARHVASTEKDRAADVGCGKGCYSSSFITERCNARFLLRAPTLLADY